jgi:hypothetical protein
LNGKVAALVWKTEINGLGDSLSSPRDTLYPLKLVVTSPTSGGRSVGPSIICNPKILFFHGDFLFLKTHHYKKYAF